MPPAFCVTPARSLRLFLSLAATLLLLAVPRLLAQGKTPPPVLRRAGDVHYREQSYALAATEYRAWLAQTPANNPGRTLIEYRLAVALGKAQQWDRAFAALESFRAAHRTSPLWTARSLYQKGLLLNAVPHQGYKVGKRLYRGTDYPHTADAETPELVNVETEDTQAARRCFESAVTAYARLPQAQVAAEETDLYFDLAKFLPRVQGWGTEADWRAARRTDWSLDPAAPYRAQWPMPKKVIFLYARLPHLDPGQAHTAALAGMARALFVAQWHGAWARWDYVRAKGRAVIVQTIPYYKWDAITLMQQAAGASPADPQAPQMCLLAAQWTAQRGDDAGALRRYGALLARDPAGKWAGDARTAIQDLRHQVVSLAAPGPQATGRPAHLNVTTQNIKRLTLRAFRLPLERILAAPGRVDNPRNDFLSFHGNFGTLQAARHLGTPVARWTDSPHDKSHYRSVTETVGTPLVRPGAYLVEADADGGKVRGAAVVLISDLAVIKKTDKDTALCFVADARTGRPVPGARVIVRESYSTGYDPKRKREGRGVKVSRGVTDADGLFAAPRRRNREIDDARVEVFAYAPGGRYALTGQSDWDWSEDDGENRDEVKIYGYTDRPVYRPGQTVYFRDLLARRRAGSDFLPVTGRSVGIVVDGPKGDQVYQRTLTTSKFGTVNGSFVLPSGASLGEYTVNASLGDLSGSSRFRVEEYKKPEYEVQVTPSTTQARFGDRVTADVKATYYFGAPVAGARVAYKVFRSPFSPDYHFPQPYDWLYPPDSGDYLNANADQGELVTQGQAATDATGNARVSFRADKGARGYDGDYAYTIQADVTDASRRRITGEGVMHVTNQAFYASLNIAQGYYQTGDTVQIELRAQNADAQPVAAIGTLTVYRVLPAPHGQEDDQAVHTETLATDADGKAFTTWKTGGSGRYKVKFQARDAAQKLVVAQAPVWVAGDDLSGRPFRVGGITLITDKTTYQEGDTAHLLIVADRPDDWVLLTQETGDQILTRTMLHVAGRARTVDVPIVRAHVPNFALAAVAVRDYQFYSWQQELFVPPARQFVHMAVTGDKAEYKPGETGTFRVKTTDYLGHPVASEVSLAVVDSSVFYIQQEYAPDLRLFLYGQRRALDINADSSVHTAVEGRSESDLAYLRFKQHGIVLPEVGRLPGDWYSLDDIDIGQDGFVTTAGRSQSFNGNDVYLAVAPSRSAYNVASAHAAPKPFVSGGPATFTVRLSDREAGNFMDVSGYPGGGELAPARVRTYFPDTAFWTPAVVTDPADGTATVHVTFPDSLTTWKATARGLTTGVQVGEADASVVTNKRLLVRLESPRFFVERDQVTLSAIVRNDLATEKTVRVSLATAGPLTEGSRPTPIGMGEGPVATGSASGRKGNDKRQSASAPGPSPFPKGDPSGAPMLGVPDEGGVGVQTITIPAHGEQRVDWLTRVTGTGQADVKMTAQTDEESDAVSQTFPVLTYGVQKFVAQSGVLGADQTTAKLTINIPAEHSPGSAALRVQIDPSLAATALDALPSLADYPYGCVEQTLSRFLPSVLVAKTLRDAGISLDALHKRALTLQAREQAGTPFGQAQPTDDDTDQTGYTYPTGTPGVMKTAELAEGLWHTDRWDNPVFDPERLQSMTTDGLARLISMQRGDGGWGWWPDSPRSDPYMSAYVVYGLATAKGAGVAVPAAVLRRGCGYIARDIKDRDDQRDLALWEAFALAQCGSLPAPVRTTVGLVYNGRDRLSAYGQALLALTLHRCGDNARAAVVCRNLENTATIDRENGTATWRPRYGDGWDWYNDDTETAAWALKAYVAVLPHSDLTPMLVKWLVTHQRGNGWRDTKETAMVVSALTDAIRANDELAAEETVTVALGDRVSRTYHITRENALLFDNRFFVPEAGLTSGPQTVTITRRGRGRLYYSSALQYFTIQEHITAAGQELKVQRRYFKLTPKTKQVADYLGGTFRALDYTRTALPDGARLQSGDLIEVELIVDSKNAYDYCCFEDMKPAGCEAVGLRSGSQSGDGLLWSDRELRDTKVAFFVDHLPQGTHALRYRLRAEVPGAFHALPTNAYAMYAPDVRALSDGWHVTVTDPSVRARRQENPASGL